MPIEHHIIFSGDFSMKVSSNKGSGEYTLKLCNEKVSWATVTTFGINKLDFSLAFV